MIEFCVNMLCCVFFKINCRLNKVMRFIFLFVEYVSCSVSLVLNGSGVIFIDDMVIV